MTMITPAHSSAAKYVERAQTAASAVQSRASEEAHESTLERSRETGKGDEVDATA